VVELSSGTYVDVSLRNLPQRAELGANTIVRPAPGANVVWKGTIEFDVPKVTLSGIRVEGARFRVRSDHNVLSRVVSINSIIQFMGATNSRLELSHLTGNWNGDPLNVSHNSTNIAIEDNLIYNAQATDRSVIHTDCIQLHNGVADVLIRHNRIYGCDMSSIMLVADGAPLDRVRIDSNAIQSCVPVTDTCYAWFAIQVNRGIAADGSRTVPVRDLVITNNVIDGGIYLNQPEPVTITDNAIMQSLRRAGAIEGDITTHDIRDNVIGDQAHITGTLHPTNTVDTDLCYQNRTTTDLRLCSNPHQLTLTGIPYTTNDLHTPEPHSAPSTTTTTAPSTTTTTAPSTTTTTAPSTTTTMPSNTATTVAAEAQPVHSAVLVTSSPGSRADGALVGRLRSNGFVVSVEEAGSLVRGDLRDVGLVVLSPTVEATALPDWFEFSPTPMLLMDAEALPQMALGADPGESPPAMGVTIALGASIPLFELTLAREPALGRAVAPPSAYVFGAAPGGWKHSLFVFDEGASLPNGTSTPERRAVFALTPDGPTQLNHTGWMLFDAFAFWLTS
jgi:hypothetical protein